MTGKEVAKILQICADIFGEEADIDVVTKEDIKKKIDEHHQDITKAIIDGVKEKMKYDR